MTTPTEPLTSPENRPVRRRLWAIHRGVEIAELTVGGLLLGTVLALVVWQAAQRYLPVSGWVGSGELARYALVWLTFILAGYLTGRGEHIGLEVVDYLVNRRLLGLVRRLADAIVAVAAVAFTMDAWNLMVGSTGRTSPAIGIPLVWVYLVPTIGFALTAVRAGWLAVVGHHDSAPDESEPAESEPDEAEPDESAPGRPA